MNLVERALKFVTPGGKVILYGIVPPDWMARVNPFDICRRDLQVIGSFSSSRVSPIFCCPVTARGLLGKPKNFVMANRKSWGREEVA